MGDWKEVGSGRVPRAKIATMLNGMLQSAPEQLLGPSFFYSPVGVVETLLKPQHGDIHVSDPICIGYAANSAMRTLHTWSFAGQLHVGDLLIVAGNS